MTHHVRAYADAGRVAPREAQLWNAGDNPTDYGVHVWSSRSVREVLARYRERGNPILIDVEHNGAQLPDGEPAVTGGYARLEVRAGAPWLVFEWSDYGRAQIESGQRRYLSAEYDVDKSTGEILALYRVSLVADPGTHHARVLAGRGDTMPADPNVRPRVSEDTVPLTEPKTPTEGAGDDAAAAALARRLSKELEVPGPVANWLAANLGANVLGRMFDEVGAAQAQAAFARRVAHVVQGFPHLRAAKSNPHGLTARELQKCKAKGIDPEKYAATKRLMMGGK